MGPTVDVKILLLGQDLRHRDRAGGKSIPETGCRPPKPPPAHTLVNLCRIIAYFARSYPRSPRTQRLNEGALVRTLTLAAPPPQADTWSTELCSQPNGSYPEPGHHVQR